MSQTQQCSDRPSRVDGSNMTLTTSAACAHKLRATLQCRPTVGALGTLPTRPESLQPRAAWRRYIYTCIHAFIHIHTYIHAYIHTHTHTYIHTYKHTYIHTYIHTCIHKYLHTYIHTYICTYIHIYTYIHPYR